MVMFDKNSVIMRNWEYLQEYTKEYSRNRRNKTVMSNINVKQYVALRRKI